LAKNTIENDEILNLKIDKKARKIEGKLSISKSHKNTLNLWFYEVVQGTSQNIFHLVQI